MRIFIFAVLLLISGCVQTVDLKNQFNPDEVSFINQLGDGKIEGQAFLTRNDGIVVYGAGSEVILIPAGRYADERIFALYKGRKRGREAIQFSSNNPQYQQMTKRTKADGEGRFLFNNLADGRYYINTNVVWKAGDYQQGGFLIEEVVIKEGAAINIILNGQ